MPAHPPAFHTAVELANAKIHRTATLFIDTRIQEDVPAALRRAPRIKHPEPIAVSVDAIGAVVLRGAVESLPERLAAAHDARHDAESAAGLEDVASLSGVVGVTNQIKVRFRQARVQ